MLAMASMVGVSLFFASCGSKSVQQETSSLSFDSVVVDTATQVINGADTLKATVHIQLMLAQGENADVVNDSIINSGILMADFMPKDAAGLTAEQKVRAFAKNFLDSYRKDCEEAIKEGVAGQSFLYSYDLTSKTEENAADSLVNFEANGYVFMGGAHGESISIARNFNQNTGAMLDKASFLAADGEKEVAKLICGDLQKQFGAKDCDDLKAKGVFMAGDAYVPNNFLVKADSVTFIYQSDEMAPHALGEIRATLGKQDLAKYLKK